MTKLNTAQAAFLILCAHQEVEKGKAYKYRFGQALWNLLPDQVENLRVALTGGSEDFFYWTDTDKVKESFFRNFVDVDS